MTARVKNVNILKDREEIVVKRVHLVANAHIDPIWLWDFDEGINAVLATFRTACDLLDRYDFIFCHNEALLYGWVEKYDQELFGRIREFIKQGKWAIIGGWYLQPDCNLTDGESLIRQIMTGKKYFSEKFGKYPKTAFNVDPFGHSRGLVQILKKCGFSYYVCNRPDRLDGEDKLPAALFIWEGYDGSAVIVNKNEFFYGGHFPVEQKWNDYLKRNFSEPVKMFMWGLGNHGGGVFVPDIEFLEKEIKKKDFEIFHSTPDNYFPDAIRTEELKVYSKSLNPSMQGCYTSMIRIKQAHRRLENELFLTEKLCSVAELTARCRYDSEIFSKVEKDLMMIQFHDVLPGSCIKDAETSALNLAGRAFTCLKEMKHFAMFRLTEGYDRIRDAGEYPVFVFNPYPYEAEEVIETEIVLTYQNRSGDWSYPVVTDEDGKEVPSQIVKENSTIMIDWCRRVCFRAKLKPMRMNRFSVRFRRQEKIELKEPERFIFRTDDYDVDFNGKGVIEGVKFKGKPVIASPSFEIGLYPDNDDPWNMNYPDYEKIRYGEPEEKFRLMNRQEAAEYLCDPEAKPFRQVEDGEVLTAFEGVYRCRNSSARAVYVFYKKERYFDIKIDVLSNEPRTLWKLCIPIKAQTLCGDAVFGKEALNRKGVEFSYQKFVAGRIGQTSLAVINDGIYGGHYHNETLCLSMLRTPVYACHPSDGFEREAPKGTVLDRIDLGERNFRFRIFLSEDEDEIPAMAQRFHQKPVTGCIYPTGLGKRMVFPFYIDNKNIILSALKKGTAGGYVVRLFNDSEKPADVKIRAGETVYPIRFKKFEVKTFILENNRLTERQEMII